MLSASCAATFLSLISHPVSYLVEGRGRAGFAARQVTGMFGWCFHLLCSGTLLRRRVAVFRATPAVKSARRRHHNIHPANGSSTVPSYPRGKSGHAADTQGKSVLGGLAAAVAGSVEVEAAAADWFAGTATEQRRTTYKRTNFSRYPTGGVRSSNTIERTPSAPSSSIPAITSSISSTRTRRPSATAWASARKASSGMAARPSTARRCGRNGRRHRR